MCVSVYVLVRCMHFVNMRQDCQYEFTLRVHSLYKWQLVQESLMENYAQFLAELFTGIQSQKNRAECCSGHI